METIELKESLEQLELKGGYIQPTLLSKEDTRVKLGIRDAHPIVECRLVSEDQYQILYNSFLYAQSKLINKKL